jgi:hypothetical protein
MAGDSAARIQNGANRRHRWLTPHDCMNATRLILIVAAAAAIHRGAHAAPVLVAVESFDYPTASNPTNGGTGWAGPWALNNVGNLVVSPGLNYPGYPASGNAMGTTVDGSSISRQLAAPVTDSNVAVLLSFLIRPSTSGDAISQRTVGNIGGGGTFILGDLAQGPGPGAENWAIQAAAVVNSNVPITGGATTLLVGKVTFGPGADTFDMWINPTIPSGADPIEAKLMNQLGASNLTTTGNLSQFSGIFFQDGNFATSQIDELLVVVDTVPPPPPDPIPGDFDGDFDVDLADYLTLSLHLHTDVSGMAPENSYLLGDMTRDLQIDGNDFCGFVLAFDAANGVGAFAAAQGGVPEPRTMAIAGLAAAALSRLGRSRRARTERSA